MAYVLIVHDVDDYQAWKCGFDRAAALRAEAGELEYQVLQSEDDTNRVVHFSKWQSHSKAKAFFESEKVQEIRNELGVKEPTFIYLNQIESGVL